MIVKPRIQTCLWFCVILLDFIHFALLLYHVKSKFSIKIAFCTHKEKERFGVNGSGVESSITTSELPEKSNLMNLILKVSFLLWQP